PPPSPTRVFSSRRFKEDCLWSRPKRRKTPRRRVGSTASALRVETRHAVAEAGLPPTLVARFDCHAFRAEFLKSVQDPQVVYYWQKGFPQLSGNKSIGS